MVRSNEAFNFGSVRPQLKYKLIRPQPGPWSRSASGSTFNHEVGQPVAVQSKICSESVPTKMVPIKWGQAFLARS